MIQGNGAVAVGTIPTLIVSGIAGAGMVPASATILNNAAATVWLGGPAVATSGASIGFPLAAGQTLNIDLRATNDLYAIAVAASTVAVLQVCQ